MPVIFERQFGQAMAKSLELQFHKAVLLKCNASFFVFGGLKPRRALLEQACGNHFPAPTTSISLTTKSARNTGAAVFVVQSTMELVP
jgi:hypothetical protein